MTFPRPRTLLARLRRALHTRTVTPRLGEEFPWVYLGGGRYWLWLDGGQYRRTIEFPVTASALAFLRDEIDRLLEETEPDPDRPGRYRHKPQTPPEDRA